MSNRDYDHDRDRESDYDYNPDRFGQWNRNRNYGNRDFDQDYGRGQYQGYGGRYQGQRFGGGFNRDYGYEGYNQNYGGPYWGQGGGYGPGYGYGSEYGEGFERGGGYFGNRGFEGGFGNRGYGGYNQWQGQDWRNRGRFSGVGPENYHRSDDRIREDVNDRLTEHGDVDASHINVQVQNGEVTLTGDVDDRQMKRAAEDVAHSVHGVKDVRNELKTGHAEHRDKQHQQQGQQQAA